MARFIAAMAGFSVALAATLGQAPIAEQKSPRAVVEEFWRAETDGGRITSEGWYKASRFFIRPSLQPPANEVIHITANGHADSIEETARTQNWAEISVTTNELGQLGSTLRFRPSPQRGPNGVLLLRGPVVAFHLVLADSHWELNQDGSRGQQLRTSPQWLIDCADRSLWINLDTAIRYVTEMQARTIDPAIKKNASVTISALKKLKE